MLAGFGDPTPRKQARMVSRETSATRRTPASPEAPTPYLAAATLLHHAGCTPGGRQELDRSRTSSRSGRPSTSCTYQREPLVDGENLPARSEQVSAPDTSLVPSRRTTLGRGLQARRAVATVLAGSPGCPMDEVLNDSRGDLRVYLSREASQEPRTPGPLEPAAIGVAWCAGFTQGCAYTPTRHHQGTPPPGLPSPHSGLPPLLQRPWGSLTTGHDHWPAVLPAGASTPSGPTGSRPRCWWIRMRSGRRQLDPNPAPPALHDNPQRNLQQSRGDTGRTTLTTLTPGGPGTIPRSLCSCLVLRGDGRRPQLGRLPPLRSIPCRVGGNASASDLCDQTVCATAVGRGSPQKLYTQLSTGSE